MACGILQLPPLLSRSHYLSVYRGPVGPDPWYIEDDVMQLFSFFLSHWLFRTPALTCFYFLFFLNLFILLFIHVPWLSYCPRFLLSGTRYATLTSFSQLISRRFLSTWINILKKHMLVCRSWSYNFDSQTLPEAWALCKWFNRIKWFSTESFSV